MNIFNFFEKIDGQEDLKGVSLDIKEDKVIVCVRHMKSGLTTELCEDAIEANTWEDLYAVLKGDREPKVLQHITRVCGYYSRVSNFNPGKLGELKDRQKGNYLV